jgi:hypothetical protein
MNNKVDVCINVFGKPWQTLCTLKTLMKHSGDKIDKIYLIIESTQPYNESLLWIFSYFDNLIIHTPNTYIFTKHHINNLDESDRHTVRYQYGIEKSDKKFIFITHNDVLYTGDIIGDMLDKIGDSVGIGEMGQCWNCPAFSEGLCSGSKFYDWNPSIEEVLSLKLPHIRTGLHNIDRENPKPMPECRLNEWACLINRELNNKETYPNGDTPFFGMYGLDLGDRWFKSLHLKGYKFTDYRENFKHSYWSPLDGGYPTQLNQDIYKIAEENAKKYFIEHFESKKIKLTN